MKNCQKTRRGERDNGERERVGERERDRTQTLKLYFTRIGESKRERERVKGRS